MEDNILSHVDDSGKARMVDVTDKEVTRRTARAYGEIHMSVTYFKCACVALVLSLPIKASASDA